MSLRRVFDVTDFGADPGGVEDSAPAVAAAVRAAVGAPAIVRFPHGRYAFRQEGASVRELYVSNTVGADPRYREKRIGVLIEGARDLEIDGDGSTLCFHGTQTTIGIIDSSSVTVRNLELDFARPTVIDATVIATGVASGRAYRELTVPDVTSFRVEGAHVVWEGETGPDGSPYWEMRDAAEYCQMLDPLSGRTLRVSDPVFEDVKTVMEIGGRIRIEYRHDRPSDDIGAVYQYRNTTRDHPGIAILESADVRLQGVTSRFLHGFGVVAQNGRDLTVAECLFEPRQDSGRYTASFADFLQCSGMSGTVTVTDTRFRGAHDDPINIHGTYLRVLGFPDEDLIDLEYAHTETAGFGQFSPGDLIEFVDADRLRSVSGPLEVVNVIGPGGRDHAHDLRRMRIRVNKAVPPEIRSLGKRLAAENITRNPDVIIERCTFAGVPTRGILVTTRGRVRIADCVFERIPMPSIYISAAASEWWESGPVTNVSIERNHFIQPGDALLGVAPTLTEADVNHPVHGTIRLRDNIVDANDDVLIVKAHSVAVLEVAGTQLPAGLRGFVECESVRVLTTDAARRSSNEQLRADGDEIVNRS